MTMNPLPPQAYTKDTLTKAYLWLLHQNESIKELATTPDILVTLFLKAQRNGNDSLDTPSIQNFKNELKSLAGMMGELDRTPTSAASQNFRSATAMPPFSSATANAPPAAPPVSAPANPQARATIPTAETHFNSQAGAPSAPASVAPSNSAPHSPPHATPSGPPRSAGPAAPQSPDAQSLSQLDGRSRAMIAEVREQLNLGSDVEVLRLFISLGYQKARNLYS